MAADGALRQGIAGLLRHLFDDLREAAVDDDVVQYLAAGLVEADEDDPDELWWVLAAVAHRLGCAWREHGCAMECCTCLLLLAASSVPLHTTSHLQRLGGRVQPRVWPAGPAQAAPAHRRPAGPRGGAAAGAAGRAVGGSGAASGQGLGSSRGGRGARPPGQPFSEQQCGQQRAGGQ